MSSYIVRVTLQDRYTTDEGFDRALKDMQDWADEVAAKEDCVVHYVEVWPESDFLNRGGKKHPTYPSAPHDPEP